MVMHEILLMVRRARHSQGAACSVGLPGAQAAAAVTSNETAMPIWLVIMSGRRPILSLQLDAKIDPAQGNTGA